MITIDGTRGEGGGQILRTSLALSLVTGKAFTLVGVRAGRAKPGLMRQHLTAVRAAATIGQARVTGDAIASTTLTFEPSRVAPGDYTFAVGSAGSATLVLQTVLLPLLLSGGPSRLTLEGGTHNPWAPPFDFLARVFLPIVNGLGGRVTASLVRPGFYPAGGGAFEVTIAPADRLSRLELLDRGDIVQRHVRAVVSNLSPEIGAREIASVTNALNWAASSGTVDHIDDGRGPGNVVMVEMTAGGVTEICTGFGAVGKTAEQVADEAATQARQYLAAGVPVGVYLADQLLPVLAVGSGGSFRTPALSRHALTNAEVIRQFLDVTIVAATEGRDAVRVDVDRKERES